jgi:hypothetical protein
MSRVHELDQELGLTLERAAPIRTTTTDGTA